jgi:hypothetical protein
VDTPRMSVSWLGEWLHGIFTSKKDVETDEELEKELNAVGALSQASAQRTSRLLQVRDALLLLKPIDVAGLVLLKRQVRFF